MDLRSSTITFGQRSKPPPGHEEEVKAQSEHITKQWLLRNATQDQENYWVPALKHAGAFSQRNALVSGEAITKEAFPFRSTLSESTTKPNILPDKILATTSTTQTLTLNQEYKFTNQPIRRTSEFSTTTISAAHSSVPSPDAFDLEMLCDSGPNHWNHMAASPSLDIIEDYEEEGLDDEDMLETPRRPPSTLPPIPSLPPPSARSVSFSPRRPYEDEKFDARGLHRQVSNDSTSSNDPLNPAEFYALSPPLLRPNQPPTFSLVPPPGKSRKSSHYRSQSQSRLLPLHLNQAPYLTTDKPTMDEQRHARVPDSVKMHWILLFVFLLCPPMWLVLASGTMDSLLHVPTYPVSGRIDSLAAAQRLEFVQVRRIKQVATVLGMSFWALCLAGMIAGLVIA